ncbi:hypothetical protein AXF42_Ash006767 [Apostasia shenzhenica]|uniref:Uncharacterized protein n=1 Tax=Apostasia shenzhenica TaxID=1088818 RepID=A0A2I0AJ63_9ASPA|nr:hypothetical protein AXF42_Ash006767 [Apostasia shenzhenica]
MASRGSHLLLLSHAVVLLLCSSTATTRAQPQWPITDHRKATAGIAAVLAYNANHGVQLDYMTTLRTSWVRYVYVDYEFYSVTVLFIVHLDASVRLPFLMTSDMIFAVRRDRYPFVQNIISGTFKFTQFAIYRH